jgi:hypothetical protein
MRGRKQTGKQDGLFDPGKGYKGYTFANTAGIRQVELVVDKLIRMTANGPGSWLKTRNDTHILPTGPASVSYLSDQVAWNGPIGFTSLVSGLIQISSNHMSFFIFYLFIFFSLLQLSHSEQSNLRF